MTRDRVDHECEAGRTIFQRPIAAHGIESAKEDEQSAIRHKITS